MNRIADAYLLLDDSCKSNVSIKDFESQNKNVFSGSTFSIIRESHEKDTVKSTSGFEMVNNFYDSTHKDTISLKMNVNLIQKGDKWKVVYLQEKLEDYLMGNNHIRIYKSYNKTKFNEAGKQMPHTQRWFFEGRNLIIEGKTIFQNRVASMTKETCILTSDQLKSIKAENDNVFNGYSSFEGSDILLKFPTPNKNQKWENLYEGQKKSKHNFIAENSIYKYKGKYHKAIKVTCLVEFTTNDGNTDKYLLIDYYLYKIGRVKSTQYSEFGDEKLSENIEIN